MEGGIGFSEVADFIDYMLIRHANAFPSLADCMEWDIWLQGLLEVGGIGGVADPSQDGNDELERIKGCLGGAATFQMLVLVRAVAPSRQLAYHLRR